MMSAIETIYEKSDTHTYKVVATRTSGKQVTYNYIEQIRMLGEVYLLDGRDQPDDGGTMEKRSFVLNQKAHGELDVRQISTVRTMPATPVTTENAEGDDALVNF